MCTNLHETWKFYLTVLKRVEKRPTTQTASVALCRSYVIENVRIFMQRMGSDIQRLSPWITGPGDQVLSVVSHQKNYIFIYDYQLWFIAIPIGSQAQQVNMIPVSVWSCTLSLQDWASNLLAWKKVFPTPSLQVMLQFLGPVAIYHLRNITRTKPKSLMRQFNSYA